MKSALLGAPIYLLKPQYKHLRINNLNSFNYLLIQASFNYKYSALTGNKIPGHQYNFSQSNKVFSIQNPDSLLKNIPNLNPKKENTSPKDPNQKPSIEQLINVKNKISKHVI